MRILRIIAFTGIGLVLTSATAEPQPSGPRVPVLLELFTSEGCSSCPPTDRLLQELDQEQPVEGADLIVLSEHVDYWNRLGWQDPFSSPQFSARQQAYTEKYGFDGVYTPQLAVDGRWGFVGSNYQSAATAIHKALREPKSPIHITAGQRQGSRVTADVDTSAFPPGNGTLYVAIAEAVVRSQVVRGENSGRLLTHVAVTRVLQETGAVGKLKQVTLHLPNGIGTSGLRLIAFVQDRKTGRILGAAQHRF